MIRSFLLMLISAPAFAYDGGFLAKNCAGANFSKGKLQEIVSILKDVKIKYSVKPIESSVDQVRVVCMARNGRLLIRPRDGGIYFELSPKLTQVMGSSELSAMGVQFEMTTRGECRDFR